MFLLLKIVHLGALMFGSAASIGNIYMLFSKGPHDLPAPEFANKLRKYFRLTGLIAIVVLWISGPALMFMKYGRWLDDFAFSTKIGFAALLLLIISFLNLVAWVAPKKGPPSYGPILMMIAAPALILAMVFAVIAFS